MTDAGAVNDQERCPCTKHVDGKSHAEEVAKLLAKEHARSVRICRQARMLKFHGLRDTDTNEWLDGYEAACCDILAALQRGRGGKG